MFVSKQSTPLNGDTLYNHFAYRSRQLEIYIPKMNGDTSNRYGWSPHIIRRFFKTWGWRSPAENWVFDAMMGHPVDANDYMMLFNDDTWMLDELEKAEPWFNIISSGVPFDMESRTETKAVQREQESRIDKLERELGEERSRSQLIIEIAKKLNLLNELERDKDEDPGLSL